MFPHTVYYLVSLEDWCRASKRRHFERRLICPNLVRQVFGSVAKVRENWSGLCWLASPSQQFQGCRQFAIARNIFKQSQYSTDFICWDLCLLPRSRIGGIQQFRLYLGVLKRRGPVSALLAKKFSAQRLFDGE